MTNRIIIADDMEIVRKPIIRTINHICKNLGKVVEIDEISNGNYLVEKVEKNNYNFIITDFDYGLCGFDGIQAIEMIRKFNATVPIYMFSGSGVKNEAMKAGATDYFDKGDFDEFNKGIEKVIKTYLI